MVITTEITKTVFEQHVPSARMPERSTSVFERLTNMFQVAYDALIMNIISPACEQQLDNNARLKSQVVRYVCLDAFSLTVRSLDLVLTATGFGIVSTESMAPASKTRVDALLEEVEVAKLRTRDVLLQLMRCASGWAETDAARSSIPTLFYLAGMVETCSAYALTSQNWQKARAAAIMADSHLRREISDEYMDELLRKARSSTMEAADIIILEKCNRFTGDCVSQSISGNGVFPNEALLRAVVHQLESYPTSYPTYVQSSVYRFRHAERYKNKKEDPSFFFM